MKKAIYILIILFAYQIGNAQVSESLINKNKLGEDKESRNLIAALIENNQDSKSYESEGDINLESNRFSDALENFNSAIKLDNNNADLYNKRGMVKYFLHKYDEAILDFKSALTINSKHFKAINNMLLTQLKLSTSDMSRLAIEKAIDENEEKARIEEVETKRTSREKAAREKEAEDARQAKLKAVEDAKQAISDAKQAKINEANDKKAIAETKRKNKIFQSKVQAGDHIRITTPESWMHAKVLSVTRNGIEFRAYEGAYGGIFAEMNPPKVMYFKWNEGMDHVDLDFK